MIPKITSGIPGLDEFISGGIPYNTITLIYGPPKTGKSIFSYHFLNQGIQNQEFCLYIMADYGINQLSQQMMAFDWYIESNLGDKIFIVDTASKLSNTLLNETNTIKYSSPQNPTDILIKINDGIKYIYQKSQNYRSILDSVTTLFAYNDPILVIRALKSYVMKLKQSGGTGIITYTEGSTNIQIENMLKASVDNIIHLNGSKMSIEAMVGCSHVEMDYTITKYGIKVHNRV
ncbi:MAG: RAD55 family ATPase [Methanosarcinales archaeon]